MSGSESSNKIAVISDTHGKLDSAVKFLMENGPFDFIIHAGDFLPDLDRLAKRTDDIYGYYGVLGNCDRMNGPVKLIIELEKSRILVFHGHKENVKNNLLAAKYMAKEENADVVIFGHTHIPVNICEDGILFLNPGSPSLPRGGSEPSLGVIYIENGAVTGAEILY